MHVDNLLSANNKTLAVIANTTTNLNTPPNWANSDADMRKGYYHFTYEGNGVLNGNSVTTTPSSFTASQINALLAKTPPVDISVVTESSGPQSRECTIKVTVKPRVSVPSGHKLFVAIVENTVAVQEEWGVANLKNGQKVVNNILRKFLPDGQGTVLDIAGLGAKTFSFTYKANDEKQKTDPLDTRIVVFIQNTTTREVIDGFKSEGHPFVTSVSLKNIQLKSSEAVCVSGSIENIHIGNLSGGSATVTVTNALGRVLARKSVESSLTEINIPFSGMAPGVVFVNVQNAQVSVTKSLLLK